MLQDVLTDNKVNLGGIEIDYASELPKGTSGMTLGTKAFALGPDAFTSKKELLLSILHELEHLKDRDLLGDAGAYGEELERLARAAEEEQR